MKNDDAVKKQVNAEGKTTSAHKQELQHPKGDTQPEMKPVPIDDNASNNPALLTNLAEVDTQKPENIHKTNVEDSQKVTPPATKPASIDDVKDPKTNTPPASPLVTPPNQSAAASETMQDLFAQVTSFIGPMDTEGCESKIECLKYMISVFEEQNKKKKENQPKLLDVTAAQQEPKVANEPSKSVTQN